MKVNLCRCDAPSCSNTSPYEDEPHSRKLGTPPYGWILVEAAVIGTGPEVRVEVCCTEHIQEAVDYAIEKAVEEWQRG